MRPYITLFEDAGDGGQGNGGGAATVETPSLRDSILQPDGAFSEGWHNALGDEFKDSAAQLSRFKSLPDFTKSFLHAQRQLSTRPQRPDEKSTPEQVKAWRDMLGLPDDENAWNIAKPEKLPEGMTWNDDLAKEVSAWAKENHIHPAALGPLVEKFNALSEAQGKAATEKFQADTLVQMQAEEKALKDAWGADFDKNLALAKRAAATAGLPADHYSLTDAVVVKALHKLAVATGEGRLVPGEAAPLTGDPKTQAQLIQTDKANPHYAAYHNPQHPQHRATREMVLNLLKQAS